ncbi:MAG: TonB-dependent receptor [Acidobacteria bacterium]|nr:TonB-dependent receptor [Acidobacteriota bacterium]
MNHLRSGLVLLVFAGFLSPVSVLAQKITSSIVGLVTDASGSAVPGAQITVTNEGTRISIEAGTDSTGNYAVHNLPAGVYEIQTKKEGFQSLRISSVQVPTAKTVRVDVILKVGEVQQSVDVTTTAPLINTDSTSIVGEISTRQIKDLPFSLQSIDTMLTLVPGAQTIRGPSNPKTGGAMYWGGTNFTVNGIAANDPSNGRGAVGFGTGMVALPPISSLQEFKVNVSGMNAEYRMQATVDLITKQGSNQFHGEAYEYNQNKALAANTFLLNSAGTPRQPFNRNQFGGNLGGPIWRNRAFFFFNYSGFRQRLTSNPRLTFPSAAMREGDFSALCSSFGASGVCQAGSGTQLYNPFTGEPFANNRIPSNLITSQARTLVQFVPGLTNPSSGLPFGTPNYIGVVSAARNFNAFDMRFDYQLTANDNINFGYTRNVGNPWFQPLGTPPTFGNGSNFGYKTFLYSLTHTHTFSPSTLNEVRVGWFNFPQIRTGQNLDIDPRSLFPQQPESPQRGLPIMNITGYSPIRDYGRGFEYYSPNLELNDNFTHVHSGHTIKAGISLTGYAWFVPNPFAALPSFSFSGRWTGNQGWPGQPKSQGNAFADFLLGVADSSASSSTGNDKKFSDRDYEFYVQDTWQAARRLTVYYGVRYMYQSPWAVRDNIQTHFDFERNKLVLPQESDTPTFPAAGASRALFDAYLPYMTTTKAIGAPLRYIQPDKNNWGPRAGFAFRPFSDNKTVLRGGYGVYYAFNPAGLGTLNETVTPPWKGAGFGIPSPQNYISGLPGTPTSPYLPDITFSNPFPTTIGTESVSSNPSIFPLQRDFQNATTHTWNLTLEREVGQDQMVRLSYVGSRTRNMTWYFWDVNVPLNQIPNVRIQDQRPLKPWADISAVLSGAKQNFHQMQVEFVRRFTNGFSAQAEYQWTRSLSNADDTGGPQRPQFRELDYGNTSFVARHYLVFNYIYELPFGRGRRWLSQSNSVADGILGGWQIAGISTYRTGTPFSVLFQVPSNYVGWWGGRADAVAGADFYSGRQEGHDIGRGVQWFNPAAFAPPQPWQWGNSAPFSVWGPGFWNWDLSVQKNFGVAIKGLEKSQLQLRADFLNLFNHFNLGNPTSTIADTRDGGVPNPSSGKIFGGTGNQRIIQVGLKFSF